MLEPLAETYAERCGELTADLRTARIHLAEVHAGHGRTLRRIRSEIADALESVRETLVYAGSRESPGAEPGHWPDVLTPADKGRLASAVRDLDRIRERLPT